MPYSWSEFSQRHCNYTNYTLALSQGNELLLRLLALCGTVIHVMVFLCVRNPCLPLAILCHDGPKVGILLAPYTPSHLFYSC